MNHPFVEELHCRLIPSEEISYDDPPSIQKIF